MTSVGLRQNFDPRAHWGNAIAVARAMSWFAKSNGANNNKKDHLALSSDDEDDDGSRNMSLSCGATPERESKLTADVLAPFTSIAG